jgi:hypothetical protein
MAVLKNRAKMSTSTTGTGTITLGSAEDGYQTFADAGVANADVVRYVIEDGNNWEIGTGTYTATGTTLSRTVSESSNADAAINLSGSATVFIGATAEDIPETDLFAQNYDGTSTKPSATGTNTIAMGVSAVAGAATDGIAIGRGANCGTATQNISIGAFSSCGFNSKATALGRGAQATGGSSLALGVDSVSAHDKSVAIGKSNSNGDDSFAAQIVNNTTSYGAQGNNSIAIGQLAKATQANSIAIGDTATSTTANQIALGGTTDTVKISGTYTLPTTDGSNGQVLTTDGAGAVTFADAGGGGADLYAANESSPAAQPSATGTNAVAIGDSAQATDTNTVAVGMGSNASHPSAVAFGVGANARMNSAVAIGTARAAGQHATALNVATSSSSYGASGNNSFANGYTAKATGGSAIAMGNASQATNTFGVAIGLSTLASGSGALALGNDAHATDTNAVAIGKSARASQNQSTAIGENNTASGVNSIAVGPFAGTASGNYSICISTDSSSATEIASIAIGDSAVSNIRGAIKFASGRFDVSSRGQAQGGQFILRADTTDATATVLTTNNSTAAATNQIAAPVNDTCIMFSGTLVAMQNGAQDQGGWEIKGLLKNDGGTTTLVSSNIQTFDDGNGWVVALTADNTNNALAITCTGEAAHNIRWVANIQTSEVTYA